ncbi:MAG: Bug family tripartite tricarboxylate transporter substrate binding protein [Beijerinckiaceae bacterium]
MYRRTIVCLLGAVAVAGAGRQAGAQDAASFFKERKLTLITSASVGGGYDQYARLLAAHMPKHIPGSPTFTVQNMPGAEGVKAANYLYNIAPKDGSVMGGLQRNTGLALFYRPDSKNAKFDARKFIWLGSTQQEIGFLLVRTATGVKSAQDLKGKDVTSSSTSRNSPSSIYPRLLNALYGSKLRVIEGYKGSQSALFALERKEVGAHVSGGTSASFRRRYRPWEKAGDVKVILQLGMERDKEYPDVPTALEIVSDPESKRIFEISFVEQVMGRPFVLPPDVPRDQADMLRKAFDATMKDKDFLAEAEKRKMGIDPVGGKRINELLDKVFASPPKLAARIRDLVK